VALYLLDNVFLLHLAFETAQSILEGLPLLKPNFCQTLPTPRPVRVGPNSYYKVFGPSQEELTMKPRQEPPKTRLRFKLRREGDGQLKLMASDQRGALDS